MSCAVLLNDNLPDHRAQRGVARYFDKIIDVAVASFGDDALVFSPRPGAGGAGKCIPAPRFPGSNFLRLHDQLASLLSARRRAGLLHSAYYGRVRTSAPLVITVYDMIIELFPHYFARLDISNPWFLAEKRRCMERADLLIAISSSAARDILTLYPQICPEKIVVIPLGVDDSFLNMCAEVKQVGKPFFLYVGSRNLAYKNFARLLAAFGQSGLAGEFNLRIISPSGAALSDEERQIIARYQLEDSLDLEVNASEQRLRTSYATAHALVYPSVYEGFGLPMLEAMASGTLVAASNTASMPEVGGDVAFYFDPGSTDAIAAVLVQMATLPAVDRVERIAQGIARAQSFTWERCQRETVALYRTLL